jgi:hypothetical protein
MRHPVVEGWDKDINLHSCVDCFSTIVRKAKDEEDGWFMAKDFIKYALVIKESK